MTSNTFNAVYIGNNRVLIKTKRDIFLRVDSNDVLVSQSLITKGEWDPVLEKLYEKILFPGANYMEIGCHIGYFSVLACCLVGIDGFCVLFEPNPKSMDLLKANLRANILTHICDINQLAISDIDGEVEFIQFSKNSASSSLGLPGERLSRDYAEDPTIIKCNTVTLDSYCKSKNMIYDFVKIDAEGAEAKIFSGGSNFFKSSLHNRSVVICEFNPPMLDSVGGDANCIIDGLCCSGREIYTYSEKGLEKRISKLSDLDQRNISELVALSPVLKKEIFGE